MRQEGTKRQDACTWCSFYVWSFLLIGMRGLYMGVCSWYNERNPGGLDVYYISVKELRY